MLGRIDKSWGYHGDDGNIIDGQCPAKLFGPKFGDGDTIGCGVNFVEEIAFYTKNGDIIGKKCSFPPPSLNAEFQRYLTPLRPLP